MNFRPRVTGRSLQHKLNRTGARTEPWPFTIKNTLQLTIKNTLQLIIKNTLQLTIKNTLQLTIKDAHY